MKVMKVNSIWAKNFMCYGNSQVTFMFRDGVTQILGENGNGKSTIFEIMYFVMFNKPFRPKVTKSDLLNDQNMKNLETGMDFEVTEGSSTDKYIIERGMKPDFFRVTKNGVKQSTASSAVNQEVLKTVITSISEGVFTSSVGLSPITAKPITEMSPEEKRTASNEMFSIKDMDAYKEKIKSRLSKYKMEEASLVASIQSLSESILSLMGVVEESKKSNTDVINHKKEQLSVSEQEYASVYDGYIAAKEKADHNASLYNKAIQARTSRTSDTVLIYINNITSSIAVHGSNIKRLENQKLSIIPEKPCNICGEPLSKGAALSKLDLIDKEIADVKAALDEAYLNKKTLEDEYGESIKEEKIIGDLLVAKSASSSSLESSLKIINIMYNNICGLKSEIGSLESKASMNDSAAETSLLAAQNKHASLVADLAVTRKNNNVCKELSKVFADDGLKAYIISGYVDSLNTTINRYLTIIGLPVTITFDYQFNYEMKSGIGVGKKYYSLSSGQRQRVNLAIALAVIDMTMAISKFKCGVLFLDEIADVSMDDSGMASFLGIISSIAVRDNKSIVLVSHKNMKMIEGSKEMINYSYEARRIEGNFSTLVELTDR